MGAVKARCPSCGWRGSLHRLQAHKADRHPDTYQYYGHAHAETSTTGTPTRPRPPRLARRSTSSRPIFAA